MYTSLFCSNYAMHYLTLSGGTLLLSVSKNCETSKVVSYVASIYFFKRF